MRLFRDSEAVTRVRWYFVDEDNEVLSIPTVFRSRDSEAQLPQAQLGEVYGTKRYFRGTPQTLFDGSNYCGTPNEWLEGCLATQTAIVNPFTSQPICCGAGPGLFGGSLAVGGSSRLAIVNVPIGGQAVGGSGGLVESIALNPIGGQAVGGSGGLVILNTKLKPVGGQAVGGSGGLVIISTVDCDCCTGVPTELTATISEFFDCACLDGVEVTLTHTSSDPHTWEGSKGGICSSNTVQVRLICPNGSFGPDDFTLEVWCDGDTPTPENPTSAACDPFDLQWSSLSSGNSCCPGGLISVAIS